MVDKTLNQLPPTQEEPQEPPKNKGGRPRKHPRPGDPVPPKPTRDERIRSAEDKLLEQLDTITDLLLKVANGVRFQVALDAPPSHKPKPHQARLLGRGEVAETICSRCRRPHRAGEAPPEIVEVWETVPDNATLRYIHEYIAGKARVRAEEPVDPEITVIFGPIDCVPGPGSPDKLPPGTTRYVYKADGRVEIEDDEEPEVGL